MEYLILSTLILLISIFIYKKKKERQHFPPGPKGYPLLGNSFDVDFESMHTKMDQWAKEFGDIYHVNLYGKDMFVLNSSEINREAFLKEPNATILADRIPGMVGKEFFYNFHDIGFSSQNESTIRRRKLGYRLMKAYGEGMVRIERIIRDVLVNLVEYLNQMEDGIVNGEQVVDKFLCGVLTSLINGRHYDVDSEFVKTLREFDHRLSSMMHPSYDMLFHWFPFIKNIPCKAGSEYKQAKFIQKKFFDLVREEKKKHPDSRGIFHDMIDAQKTERTKKGELWISDDDINGIMTNLVTAAFLTTKGTLMSLLRYLIENPNVQKRLQEEVDAIVGSNEVPKLNHRSKMPYTEAVVMETLRIISHIPLAVPHRASRPTTIRGYEIPKGATVMFNLWTAHHNEKVYPSPFKFHPERFLDDDGQLLPHDSEPVRNMVAFGLGKRSCIGEVFARSRMFLFVSTIMQNYTLLQDENNPLPPFNPLTMRPGAVRIPDGYICKVEKRKYPVP